MMDEFEELTEVEILDSPLTPEQSIRVEALNVASVTCRSSQAYRVVAQAMLYEKYIKGELDGQGDPYVQQ